MSLAQLESIEEHDDAETEVSRSSTLSFRSELERFRHLSDHPNADAKPPSSNSPLTRASQKRKCPSSSTEKSRLNSSSPAKRSRPSSRYAPPSKYAHLSPLVDILAPDMICVFVGTNPGVRTAWAGHAYAHPSNLFWKLLHSSGCTDIRLKPEQDVDLLRLYRMGNTNIVDRPSKDAAELSKAEMAAGTPILEEKFRRYRPEAVCLVGKGIWEAVWRWRYGREIRKDEFRYGWQDEKERMGKVDDWPGARVFVATSTSGLSASTTPKEKAAIWRPFGEWVRRRREERTQ